MELRKLLQQLKVRLLPLSLFIVISAVSGYVFVSNMTVLYRAEVSLYVDKTPETVDSGTYGYDGYYAQQVAEAYTDTIVGLLQQPDLLVKSQKLLDWAETLPYENIESSVSVMRVAPQVVQLTVTMDNSGHATEFVSTLSDVAMNQVKSFNQEEDKHIRLMLVNDSPLVSIIKYSPFLGAIAGALLATGIGVLVVSAMVYMKEDE